MTSVANRPVCNVTRFSLARPKDDPLMFVRNTLFGLLLCLSFSVWSAPQVRFPDGDLAYAQTDLSVPVRGGEELDTLFSPPGLAPGARALHFCLPSRLDLRGRAGCVDDADVAMVAEDEQVGIAADNDLGLCGNGTGDHVIVVGIAGDARDAGGDDDRVRRIKCNPCKPA